MNMQELAAQLIAGLDLAARLGLQNGELRPVRGSGNVKIVIDRKVVFLFSLFASCRHTTTASWLRVDQEELAFICKPHKVQARRVMLEEVESFGYWIGKRE
ncbi:hypothetical protein JHK82_050371 [Glycine max]|nr:hypothetical protein JHK85_051008 [Glycine max]KAG5091593.1 hypothetical protein JHK82_050371 [Glycine max]